MTLKLYKMILSPPARAAMMTADALKIPVELVDCNFLKGDNLSSEFLKKNPMHTVPVLEDGEFCLPDSHAIMIYLATLAKNTSLYPSNPKARAMVHARLFFDTGLLFPNFRKLSYSIFFEGLKQPPKDSVEEIEKCYTFTEAFLTRTKFIADDTMTLADISCVTNIAGLNILNPLDKDKHSRTLHWWENMKQQSFYKKYEHGHTQLEQGLLKALKKNNSS